MALPPPPEPSVLDVLQGLVIKLREGTSYAEQLQKKFVSTLNNILSCLFSILFWKK